MNKSVANVELSEIFYGCSKIRYSSGRKKNNYGSTRRTGKCMADDHFDIHHDRMGPAMMQ